MDLYYPPDSCVGRLTCTRPREATSKEDLKHDLVKLEKQSWEAWKNRDGKFYENFLYDDHVELGTGGPFNKSSVVSFVGSPVCAVKSYTVDHFELTTFDANTALLTYHAAQETTCSGKAVPSSVWVSSLYVRRDGRWLNALYQQTPATPK
ncbi:MAG: hypothetical protein DLM52_08600 [Chthoniobacterales bacterium]|nr:MAG: hypothetical protein DLM52_08600 [Chthoniobacterales bacterium]